jgi:hypothetical protein
MHRKAAGLQHPNLLLVGFAKCGTTSLAKYLTDHPQIAAPVAKELYVLIDEESGFRSMQPIIDTLTFGAPKGAFGKDYIEFFPERAGCRYALDATPFYYSQATAVSYVQEHPDVRIIFMLRDPAQRLYSSFQYFQNVFQEYPSGSFDEFVDALLDPNSGSKYREKIRKQFFRKLFDDELDSGNYERHISAWVDVIGRERVYMGKLEELNATPVEFMRDICRFIGIDPVMYEQYAFQPFMRSYRVRLPMLQAWSRKLGKEDPIRYDRMREYQSPFHRVPVKWLRNTLDNAYGIIQRKAAPQDISGFALQRLQEHYEPANMRLKHKYGIDYSRSQARSAA